MIASLDLSVRVGKDVMFRELDGEAVLLNLESGKYYGLDPVGARIWSLLATPKTVARVRDSVLAEYEVDAARCESDLLALLDALAAAGLVLVG